MGVPLRDRDDLPDDVARVLAVRRHAGNPWTEEDALVVARFSGYTPTEPWPGSTGRPWPGVCTDGHECSPTLTKLLAGTKPCNGADHAVGRWSYVHLRDRDDLTPEIEEVLKVRRHAWNPWTDEEARLVARFAGYEPSEPWPGNVNMPWPGICHEGHSCRPYFVHILRGRPACGQHHKDAGSSRRVERPAKPGHLRQRTDLPEDIAALLAIARTTAQPWTDPEARRIAEFVGFTPTSPWPGGVSKPWAGVCHALGHECSPRFDALIGGSTPCGECRKEERRDKRLEHLRAMAAERGEEILSYTPRRVSAGKIGTILMPHLVVRYACGHLSSPEGIPMANYTSVKAGCGICWPTKLIRGQNDLTIQRPDVSAQMAPPWDPSQFAVSSNLRVDWLCEDCGHRWRATVGARTQLASGCPECNGSGGYDERLPGTVYVIKGISKLTREVLVKVGISNVPVNRLYRHHRQGLTEVLASGTWSDGSVPVTIERHWKGILRAGLPDALHATKTDLMDGYREAVRDSEESWQAVSRLLDFARAQSPQTLTEWEQVLGLDDRDVQHRSTTH